MQLLYLYIKIIYITESSTTTMPSTTTLLSSTTEQSTTTATESTGIHSILFTLNMRNYIFFCQRIKKWSCRGVDLRAIKKIQIVSRGDILWPLFRSVFS